MSDRLARFQENIDACNEKGELVVFIGAGFAQDVLEVAKAARVALAALDDGAEILPTGRSHKALRAALSALDGEEGEA